MYVKIIDKGECFSTTNEYIDGVYANKSEWEKHNFYPRNGMVGEIVKRTPSAFIVKIKDGIFVPLTRKGIKEISQEEFLANQSANTCDGMDKQQRRLYKRYENFISDGLETDMNMLPDMREAFRQDIIHNMSILTCDFHLDVFLPDLEESAVIYAADMCLEYISKAGRELSPSLIKCIGGQVMDVYMGIFSSDFDTSSKDKCICDLMGLMERPEYARNRVDNYYARINHRYNYY